MTEVNHSFWRSADGLYTVVIAQACFDEMVHLARSRSPNEIGTSLVGTYSDDAKVAYATGLAPVSKDSRGARTTFQRGIAGLRRFLSTTFAASKGRTHYVGEWHSHPGGAPVPSPTDEENSMEIASDPEMRCPECILIILSLQGETVEPRVYVFSRKRGRLDLLRMDG